jgi:hypothetical protein
MITRIAIKQGDTVYTKPIGCSHHHVLQRLIAWGGDQDQPFISGFLTDKGEFLDRKEAAKHAIYCGQVDEKDITHIGLDSFDLINAAKRR